MEEQRSQVAALERTLAQLTSSLAAVRADRQERLRALADALPVMLAYVDREQRFRFANRSYERWFERPLGDIVGRTLSELMNPGIYAQRLPHIERALGGERQEYEAAFPHGSGVRHALMLHVPDIDEHGGTRGFYTLIQDVTEQHRALEVARESEARFRRIADSAPVPMWVTGPDRTREFVNIAYAEFLSLPYEEALLFDWRTILHHDDQQRVLAESAAGEASHERFALEARYRRGDGEWRWLRSTSQPRFDNRGMPEGFIGVAEDITEAKRASDLARLHAEQLEARVDRRTRERDRLWEVSQDGIMVADRNGLWLSASPAWTRLLGWSLDSLVGSTVRRLVHPDDRATTAQAWSTLLGGQVLRGFTNRLRAADGEYRWFTWSAVPEGDSVYCTARDTTASLKQGEALREAEEALRQAQKVEALGQLTGGVAHDFNNLLTPIMGTLDFLGRRQDNDPRTQRMLDGAMQSADRAKTLVQRLLAFARRQPLSLQAVDVGKLVLGLDQLLRSTLGAAVDVQLQLDEEVPPALADPHQVELALLNLAVNARDAMPGGGRIDIRLRATVVPPQHGGLAAGRYVALSVHDTGVGMSEEIRRRSIEPFFSTKGPGNGTGLGLSMVHGLAGQLGGELTIDSQPGRGTAIELLLPCTETSSTAAVPEAEVASREALAILLVDDEALVRASTASMLAEIGHRVIACASAAEALAAINDGLRPDLLVTDQIMPAMSGTELIAEFRQRLPGVPALVVSGYRGEVVEEDTPFLPKPFTLAQLVRALSAAAG